MNYRKYERKTITLNWKCVCRTIWFDKCDRYRLMSTHLWNTHSHTYKSNWIAEQSIWDEHFSDYSFTNVTCFVFKYFWFFIWSLLFGESFIILWKIRGNCHHRKRWKRTWWTSLTRDRTEYIHIYRCNGSFWAATKRWSKNYISVAYPRFEDFRQKVHWNHLKNPTILASVLCEFQQKLLSSWIALCFELQLVEYVQRLETCYSKLPKEEKKVFSLGGT